MHLTGQLATFITRESRDSSQLIHQVISNGAFSLTSTDSFPILHKSTIKNDEIHVIKRAEGAQWGKYLFLKLSEKKVQLIWGRDIFFFSSFRYACRRLFRSQHTSNSFRRHAGWAGFASTMARLIEFVWSSWSHRSQQSNYHFCIESSKTLSHVQCLGSRQAHSRWITFN